MSRRAPAAGYGTDEKAAHREAVWDAFARQWGDALPDQHALVLPSAEGLEIETAVARGVQENRIVAVDDDPAVIASSPWRWTAPYVLPVHGKVGDTARDLADRGVRVGVAHLDLCGTLSRRTLAELRAFGESGILRERATVAVTVSAGRESEEVAAMAEVMYHRRDLDDLAAVRAVVAREHLCEHVLGREWECIGIGTYRSSGGTTMAWAAAAIGFEETESAPEPVPVDRVLRELRSESDPPVPNVPERCLTDHQRSALDVLRTAAGPLTATEIFEASTHTTTSPMSILRNMQGQGFVQEVGTRPTGYGGPSPALWAACVASRIPPPPPHGTEHMPLHRLHKGDADVVEHLAGMGCATTSELAAFFGGNTTNPCAGHRRRYQSGLLTKKSNLGPHSDALWAVDPCPDRWDSSPPKYIAWDRVADWVRRTYPDKGATISEIMRELGCNRRAVGRARARYGWHVWKSSTPVGNGTIPGRYHPDPPDADGA